MNYFMKKLSSKLPKRFQQELKRLYCAFQIKKNTFTSEEPEYEQLDQWVKSGDWVLDIGANIGHYTLKLSKLVGNKGRVFAFEPISDTFELLASNVTKFPYRNTTLFNAAVSDSEKEVGMEMPKFDSGLDNYYMAHLTSNSTSNNVYCLTIDCYHFPNPVAFVKIDVEDYELQALMGMKKLIMRDHPVIVAEGISPDVADFLKGFGYSYYRLEGSPNTIYEYK